MPFDLPANADRFLADARIEGERPFDGVVRGEFATYNLNERNKVWRTEGMTEHNPFRVLRCILNRADQNSGRTRRNNRMVRYGSVYVSDEVAFNVQTLWAILLDKIDARKDLRDVRAKCQTVLRGSPGEAELLKCRPVTGNDITQVSLRSVRRVGRPYIKPA